MSGDESRPAAVYLPVTHALRVDPEQARLSVRKLLAVLARMWRPSTLRFVVAVVGPADLSMGWQVTSATVDESLAVANDLRIAAQQSAPWLGLGSPTLESPWPELGPPRYAFEPAPTDTGHLVPVRSLAWPAVRDLGTGSWHLVLTVHTLPHVDPNRTPAGGVSRVPWEAAEAERSTMLASLTLHGPAKHADTLAHLVAEDTVGGHGLAAVPAEATSEDRPCDLSPDLVAHLLATPSRVHGMLPEYPPSRSDAVFAALEDGASPHILIQGLSGGGKTTLLAHLLDRSMSRGRPVFVVDPHDGALIAQLAERARRHGLDPLVVWLGAPDPVTGRRPALRMTQAPPDVDPRAWAVDMWTLTYEQMHGDRMDPGYVGPVGDRAGTLAYTALCLDPDPAPAVLDDLPRLLDPSDGRGFRREVFARIGDLDLARAWMREVMPMVTQKDPGNAAIWMTAKVQPLIASPVIADLFCGRGDEIPLEEALDAARPILVHAPATLLGETGSRVAWALLLHRYWMWRRRTNTGAGYDVAADEWHLNPLPTVERMLAEVRKYGDRMLLSNQSLAQLPSRLRAVMLANVGAVATFATSRPDAELLDDLFPTLPAGLLPRLPKYHVAVTNRDRDLVAPTPHPLPQPTSGAPQVWMGGATESLVEHRPAITPPDDPAWDDLFGRRQPWRSRRPSVSDTTDEDPLLSDWLAEGGTPDT